jgi:hypothetical protein
MDRTVFATRIARIARLQQTPIRLQVWLLRHALLTVSGVSDPLAPYPLAYDG